MEAVGDVLDGQEILLRVLLSSVNENDCILCGETFETMMASYTVFGNVTTISPALYKIAAFLIMICISCKCHNIAILNKVNTVNVSGIKKIKFLVSLNHLSLKTVQFQLFL